MPHNVPEYWFTALDQITGVAGINPREPIIRIDPAPLAHGGTAEILSIRQAPSDTSLPPGVYIHVMSPDQHVPPESLCRAAKMHLEGILGAQNLPLEPFIQGMPVGPDILTTVKMIPLIRTAEKGFLFQCVPVRDIAVR